MPKFDSREEYERWKAEQLGKGREKGTADRGAGEESSGPEKGEKSGGEGQAGPPPAAAVGAGKGNGGLPDVGDLFTRAWGVFKVRFGILIGLFLFTFLLFAAVLGVFAGAGFLLAAAFSDQKALSVLLVGIIGGTAAFWVLFWGGAALTFAVADDSLGFGEALGRSRGRVCSFVWIMSLTGFIVTGGFLLFFVPGILFSVWFAFPLYILAKEGERGMNALLKSKEYVRDQWFPVFLRLFLVWVLSAVIGVVPFIGPFLSLAFVPYMLIFVYLLYQDLVSLKGSVAYEASGGRKCGWLALGGLGYIVAPIVIVALVGASLLGTLMLFTGIMTAQPDKFGDILRRGIIPGRPASPPSELEGVWHPARPGEREFEWRFTGTEFDIVMRKGAHQERMKGRMLLRTDVEPKEIDITITEATTAQYLGKTSLGIFQSGKDMLTICAAEPGLPSRPRSFSETEDGKCFSLVRGPWAVPEAAAPQPPGGIMQQAPAEKGERVWVYIYALNYAGTVRLNGKQIYEMKGERDMNYNFTMGEQAPVGTNVIDLEYASLPDPWKAEIRIRVSAHGTGGQDRVIGEWAVADQAGKRQFTFQVP